MKGLIVLLVPLALNDSYEGGRNLLDRAGPALSVGVPIFGFVLLVIVIALWLYKRHQSRKNQIRPQEIPPTITNPVFEVVVSDWSEEVSAMMSAQQGDQRHYDLPKAPPSHGDLEAHQYAIAQNSLEWHKNLYATGDEASQNSSGWHKNLYATGDEASQNSLGWDKNLHTIEDDLPRDNLDWNQDQYATGGNVAPKVPPRKGRAQIDSQYVDLSGEEISNTSLHSKEPSMSLVKTSKKEKLARTVSNGIYEEVEMSTVGTNGLFAQNKTQKNNKPMKSTAPPAGFSMV